jgi:hypothetical protein
MTGEPDKPGPSEGLEEQLVHRAAVTLRSLGHPNSIARAYDFLGRPV